MISCCHEASEADHVRMQWPTNRAQEIRLVPALQLSQRSPVIWFGWGGRCRGRTSEYSMRWEHSTQYNQIFFWQHWDKAANSTQSFLLSICTFRRAISVALHNPGPGLFFQDFRIRTFRPAWQTLMVLANDIRALISVRLSKTW